MFFSVVVESESGVSSQIQHVFSYSGAILSIKQWSYYIPDSETERCRGVPERASAHSRDTTFGEIFAPEQERFAPHVKGTIEDSTKGGLTQFWKRFTMIPCALKDFKH